MLLKAFHGIRVLLFRTGRVDNFVFHLHYRWSVLFLVIISFVVTCRLWFGDSFSCLERKPEAHQHHLDMVCYSRTLFTRQKELALEIKTGKMGNYDKSESDMVKYYTHYGWVNLVLLVQAFLFYLPHLFWRYYERGHALRLATAIDNVLHGETRRNMELCLLAKYVTITQGTHQCYVLFYISMECCNFLIAMFQTMWLVHFFQVTGVPDELDLTIETWSDFTQFYFPSSGKCVYQYFGSSGDVETHSAWCLMPLNQLYMYIFVFMYAWYIVLTILSALVLIYRLCLLVSSFRAGALCLGATLCKKSILMPLCKRLSYCDWFFLKLLRDNLSDVDFAQLLDKISVTSRCCKSGDECDDGLDVFHISHAESRM